MAKTKQSELQKAADRVREAELIKEIRETARANAQIDMEQAKLKYEESVRHYESCLDEFYNARNAVTRALQSVRSLVGYDNGAKADNVLERPY